MVNNTFFKKLFGSSYHLELLARRIFWSRFYINIYLQFNSIKKLVQKKLAKRIVELETNVHKKEKVVVTWTASVKLK